MFLVPPSCVYCGRRPDLYSKRCPLTSFLFVESFFLPVCVSRGMEVAAHHPILASCYSALEFGGIADSSRRPSLTPAKSKLQWIWFPSFCQECRSHVLWSQFQNHSQECCSECCSMSPGDMVLSFVMPTGIVLIHSVLSMETRLGQVAPLVMVCFACRESGSGYL